MDKDNTIDSRTLAEEFLEVSESLLSEYNDEKETDVDDVEDKEFLKWIENNDNCDSDFYDTIREYIEMRDFIIEFKDYSQDFSYGSVAIREDYFEDYARQLTEDIGIINDVSKWPANYIDWEKAADALSYDYSLISFGDTDYYVQ